MQNAHFFRASISSFFIFPEYFGFSSSSFIFRRALLCHSSVLYSSKYPTLGLHVFSTKFIFCCDPLFTWPDFCLLPAVTTGRLNMVLESYGSPALTQAVVMDCWSLSHSAGEQSLQPSEYKNVHFQHYSVKCEFKPNTWHTSAINKWMNNALNTKL